MSKEIVELTKEQYDELVADIKELQKENKELKEDVEWKRNLIKSRDNDVQDAHDRRRAAESYGRDIAVKSNKYKRKLVIKKIQYEAALVEINDLKKELYNILKDHLHENVQKDIKDE